MTILNLLAQRHRKHDPQPADEIFLLIAVENDRVHGADRFLAGVEIKPHNERQPLARAALGFVHPFDLQHRAHRAGLLDGHFGDVAHEFIPARLLAGLLIRPALIDAHEPALSRDFASTDGERFDQVRAREPDATDQLARVDIDRRGVFPDAHFHTIRHRRIARANLKRPRYFRADDRRDPRPLHRTVRGQ